MVGKVLFIKVSRGIFFPGRFQGGGRLIGRANLRLFFVSVRYLIFMCNLSTVYIFVKMANLLNK